MYGPGGVILPIQSVSNPGGIVSHANQWTDKLHDGDTNTKWYASSTPTTASPAVLEVTLTRPAKLGSGVFPGRSPPGRFQELLFFLVGRTCGRQPPACYGTGPKQFVCATMAKM